MSAESQEWLNANILVGYTAKRGNAWWYDPSLDGEESSQYDGPIPVEDIARRIFNWQPVKCRMLYEFDHAGRFEVKAAAERIVIARSDTAEVLGTFKNGYSPHDYNEWLVKNVADILDSNLGVGSAGLLKGGAVAFVSVEVPDTITTPEGVAYRPNLLAVSSFDGSLATTYKDVITNVVCDNTMAAGLAERGNAYKVKHTKNSQLKISDARDALRMIHTMSEAFEAEVRELTNITVSEGDFEKFLNELVPVPTDEGRSQTMALNKQDTLKALYRSDPRVKPWSGSAYGVLQAVNTYDNHEGIVRGSHRAERNLLRAATGGFDALDSGTFDVLQKVLATEERGAFLPA